MSGQREVKGKGFGKIEWLQDQKRSGYREKLGRSDLKGCGGQGRARLTSSLEGLGIRGAEEAVEGGNGCCSWY